MMLLKICRFLQKGQTEEALLEISAERENTDHKTACNKTQMTLLGTYISVSYSVRSHSECVHMECVRAADFLFWLWADMSHPASVTISECGIHERRGITPRLSRLAPPGP